MKYSSLSSRSFFTALLVMFALNVLADEPASPRERLLMDSNWKFHLGNDWGNAFNRAKGGLCNGAASQSFSDNGWRTVNLPHDWVVELPFDSHAEQSHGFKPVGPGYATNSYGWYRRTFTLPAGDAGKRLWLEFDGAFRDAQVFVNGWFVGHHEGGYNSFRYDITDVVNCGGTNGGTNFVAVLIDASRFEGWFYEGAGLYRHVWLVKTAPLAIAPDGIFVYSSFKNNVPGGSAQIHLETVLNNSQDAPAEARVKWEILNPQGKRVAHSQEDASVAAWNKSEVKATTKISSPQLWSPENVALYKLVTTVESGGKVIDREETSFGIRTVGFDADKGFMLNGKPYELKGTCNHQDMAGVGAALPDALQYFRIARLKEMGCNAYRTSHNPPTAELLDACDRLGMLVMDESRILGSDEENLRKFDEQIRRDRNHASVAIWSICNEEDKQNQPDGGRVGLRMQQFVKNLDSTRPVTAAENIGDVDTGFIAKLDVRGWNYHVGKEMDDYHAKHPQQPNVGTEQASAVGTRGIYHDDKKRGYVSSFDVNAPEWATTAEKWYSYFAARQWLSGGFVWTGFDYRGEPTPYSWPCINSHFGILDTCGFAKDSFYYYQSWWKPNQVVLHLMPHWNWPGKEGQEIEVCALSNCKEVELFLNGESLGRKTMKKTSKLEWSVKYAPGTLSAKGYNDGKLVAETKVETTGEPAAIQLACYNDKLAADGEDASPITVNIVDAQGRIVPTATNLITFELSGQAHIIGVGNGDPSCHEPDVYLTPHTVKTVPFNDWLWKVATHVGRPSIDEYKTDFDDSAWSKTDTFTDESLMGTEPMVVYRQHLNLTDEDLTNNIDISIHFGCVIGHCWIFANGRLMAQCGDPTASPSYSIKKYLHAGDNVIAVGVNDESEGGGITRGVNLEMKGLPENAPIWQRSVFNGYGQVIVQSAKRPGEITLTATANGLPPATLTINSTEATPRPSVP